MKELAEILSTLFRKISDFFDILDLSFFVSGLFGLAPLAYWLVRENHVARFQQEMGPFLFGIGLIVGTYVAGLICFAGGRAARRLLRWLGQKLGRGHSGGFSEYIERALRSHGLHEDPGIADYVARRGEHSDSMTYLYVRMWAKLRETPVLASSFVLVKRYWIMSAIYDGLGCALLLWLGAGITWKVRGASSLPLGDWSWVELIPVLLGLVVVVLTCFKESARLSYAQVDELVATLALIDPARRMIWSTELPAPPRPIPIPSPLPPIGATPTLFPPSPPAAPVDVGLPSPTPPPAKLTK